MDENNNFYVQDSHNTLGADFNNPHKDYNISYKDYKIITKIITIIRL